MRQYGPIHALVMGCAMLLACAAGCDWGWALCDPECPDQQYCHEGRCVDCVGTNLGGRDCRSLGFHTGVLKCTKQQTLDLSGCHNCGNKLVEPTEEECDGDNLYGMGCEHLGFDGGDLFCGTDCMFNTASCSTCGDGEITGDELCDGENLGAASCLSLLFHGGELACHEDCTFDTSGCEGCGDGIMNWDEQCDGEDLGGKTCAAVGLEGADLSCTEDCLLTGCQTTGYVAIQAGTFQMGSSSSEMCRDNKSETLHQVTLTRAYEMATTEVTQQQFQTVMGYLPAGFEGCGTSCPVETVSWSEAAAYCNKLSLDRGLTPCYSCKGSEYGTSCDLDYAYMLDRIYECPGYRLPTEAEWEYAYRAQTSTSSYKGEITKCMEQNDPTADIIGWNGHNSGGQTHPTGQKAPNNWGLYDMAGNVWEYCSDWYQEDLGSAAVTDPFSDSMAQEGRVIRGGGWGSEPADLRAARRKGAIDHFEEKEIGFRCVRGLL